MDFRHPFRPFPAASEAESVTWHPYAKAAWTQAYINPIVHKLEYLNQVFVDWCLTFLTQNRQHRSEEIAKMKISRRIQAILQVEKKTHHLINIRIQIVKNVKSIFFLESWMNIRAQSQSHNSWWLATPILKLIRQWKWFLQKSSWKIQHHGHVTDSKYFVWF